jgi:hypothetical protein
MTHILLAFFFVSLQSERHEQMRCQIGQEGQPHRVHRLLHQQLTRLAILQAEAWGPHQLLQDVAEQLRHPVEVPTRPVYFMSAMRQLGLPVLYA